jgi:hypothetical protein
LLLDKNIKASEFGLKYSQTFKFLHDYGLLLSESKLYTLHHKNWEESIMDYKTNAEGNWIKVFARALDFYRGNIKGY